MKKILSAVLASLMLVTLFAFTGCKSKSDKLTVYTEAGFAPYEFWYNNEIVGVDVEIMKAVAEKLGKELKFEDVAFKTICTSVKSGKADAGAAGISINDERKETVDFSIPYSSTAQYIVVADDNETIKSAEDLNGKQIGVQEGTTSDFLIDGLMKENKLTGATLIPYESPAVAAASIGKIDAVVTDKLTAEIIVANNSNLKTFKLANADGSDVGEVEEYGIAVAKGNEELLKTVNEVITELLKDGSIDKWVSEYTEIANKMEKETGTD